MRLIGNEEEGIFEELKRPKFEGYLVKKVIQYNRKMGHFLSILIRSERSAIIMDGK